MVVTALIEEKSGTVGDGESWAFGNLPFFS